ncbi:MAG TPA: cellulase, partial [Chitinophagaceae bacterium]|nr:cellulase [Chitinophagaceae bacterium]
EMEGFGISRSEAPYFLPPYEWYNDTIAAWTKGLGLQLINFTPGTLTHADYTTPVMKNYRSSDVILQSVNDFEKRYASGLNGFIMLMHIGAGPQRKDKLHDRLEELVRWMKGKGYELTTINKLF